MERISQISSGFTCEYIFLYAVMVWSFRIVLACLWEVGEIYYPFKIAHIDHSCRMQSVKACCLVTVL